MPEWQGVLNKKVKAGELRGEGKNGYVFAFGLGWQALALVGVALITHRPGTRKTDLAKAVQAVDWRRGPHWNSIAVIGDRMNNTRPGVRATAGYILKELGFTKDQGTDIKDLLEGLERSQVPSTTG